MFQQLSFSAKLTYASSYKQCCDAGGNNSRLLSMLRQKKLKNGQSWLNEEDCSIKHTTDPSRRLYIWFCTTHILKALRGQFLSSHQSGKKAFQDSAGTNFGWAFVEYLYAEVQRLNKESGGSITNGVRLDAKAVNPNKSDKMSAKTMRELASMLGGLN